MRKKTDARGMLHGTLDALILKTLTWGVRHGYGIARWLEETTDDAVPIEEGSLYPALYRLERRGLIRAGDVGKDGCKQHGGKREARSAAHGNLLGDQWAHGV